MSSACARLFGIFVFVVLGLHANLAAPPNVRRILYNLDGDSCLTLKAGRNGPGPITTNDLVQLVDELTAPGSQVDTLLVCVNAQVVYYPSQVGTLRGTLSTEAERAAWPASERQRFANLEGFFAAGLDPYALILREARRRGLETFLTFRMNDAHGNDFLRTAFWRDHPESRLPNGALDFGREEVREYIFRLIEEAMERYDCDGLELDFQRFPTFFAANSSLSPAERSAAMNGLVERVRLKLTELSTRRGKRLFLSARIPSAYGMGAPTYAQSVERGCDPAEWARRGWIDFLTISEWLFTAPTLDLADWRKHITGVPLYAGIQPESQPSSDASACEHCLGASGYRRLARERWADGADGIYLFNFFTTREWREPLEPPWEVLKEIGSPNTLARFPVAPWETNKPIATIRAERYRPHVRPRAAAMTAMHRVGPGLERREWQATETQDDVADEQKARWSLDNGRTWSEWVPQQPSSLVDYAGVKVWEGGWADTFDPVSGRLVQLWLRQIQREKLYHCFSYVRTSTDLGRTWSAPVMLRYEPGPGFDPQEPASPAFLDRNEGYPGNNIARLEDGTLVLVLAHANAPGDPRNNQRPWRMGSVLFRGRWDSVGSNYVWTAGARIEISPERSARGLMEPEVAVLKDGRLLVVWRGSDEGWDGTKATEPGRKWFSLSTDGGRTLAPVEAWRYADGSEFYSASSIHRMLRHRGNGRLYWLGNLSVTPPRGNHPRHPLVIAEVDETAAALKRETVTVIADRSPYHGPDVQFSNFSLLENPETSDLELYLTTYGQERDPADWATADSWKYAVSLQRSRDRGN
ncbi:MAG TPA: hypothetical protein PLX89_23195 [Verrucomicrobiota bacterium]|nr:hypothetical protein [Verrucomicrobiales bacterium]HRI15915.1 hypothetical protein [Verrucomicrobiota bacterium]